MQPRHDRTMLLRLLALCAASAPAVAAVQENLEEMRQIARERVEFMLGPGVDVDVSRPDPRLHLARCDVPLEVLEQGRPLSVGNNTLSVRCSGTSPWTIYLTARVSRSVPVLVTNRPLGLGHVITADDIDLISQDQGRLLGNTVSDPSMVIGQVVARPLNAGTPVTTNHIEQAAVVKRGERVTIRSGSRRFAVEAPGKALADGTPGSRIRVENLRSKRIVEGVVRPDRVIDVAL